MLIASSWDAVQLKQREFKTGFDDAMGNGSGRGSSRDRLPLDTRNKGSKCVSVTRRDPNMRWSPHVLGFRV